MMTFNDVIQKKFGELFSAYGYSVSENSADARGGIIAFSSENLVYRFVENKHEFSFCFDIVYLGTFVCENFILEEFLKTAPAFSSENENTPGERWAEQVRNYFIEYSDSLLKPDRDFFLKLGTFSNQKTIEYNQKFQ